MVVVKTIKDNNNDIMLTRIYGMERGSLHLPHVFLQVRTSQVRHIRAPKFQIQPTEGATMFAVRRFCRSTSANAAQAAAKEQTKVHVPVPHTPTEVPPYPSGLRGETLAGQRRGNIR